MIYMDTPMFGFTITIIYFIAGVYINKRIRLAIINPMLIAIGLIIVTLIIFDIEYETYIKGGEILSFFLSPAIVILAVPLYKHLEKIKNDSIPILIGIIGGSAVSIISIFYMSKLLKLNNVLILSIVPKSATSAISQEISAQIGGDPALTIAAAVITVITGYALGPYVFKLFKIEDKVAIGISLGTASHATGIAKAMELGEIETAMSSLAIGLAGLVIVLMVPWLLKVLS